LPFWFTALLILIFDQGTKWLIKENMELYQSIPIIPNIFHLTYIENPGAAFGILANQRIFFIIITFIILAFIYYFYRQLKENQVLLKIALGMVVGGALGNLIDRWRSGTVTDFFDFQIWPIFNIADTAVVVAMLYISYKVLTTKEEI
jgi:signal peptidase II